MFCINAKAPTIAAMLTIMPANIINILVEPILATSPCNNAAIMPNTRTTGVNDSKTKDKALAFSTVFFMLSIRANAPAMAIIVIDSIANKVAINVTGPNADSIPLLMPLERDSLIFIINAAIPPTVAKTILIAVALAINFNGSSPRISFIAETITRIIPAIANTTRPNCTATPPTLLRPLAPPWKNMSSPLVALPFKTCNILLIAAMTNVNAIDEARA